MNDPMKMCQTESNLLDYSQINYQPQSRRQVYTFPQLPVLSGGQSVSVLSHCAPWKDQPMATVDLGRCGHVPVEAADVPRVPADWQTGDFVVQVTR